MLKQAKLPNYFWVKVIQITVYLQNRTPIKVVARKTLEEMCTSEKPNLLLILGLVEFLLLISYEGSLVFGNICALD